MTDYNAIADTETDPSAPLKSSLFKRMVANPIAITEGATGAPRIRQAAFDALTAGTTYSLTLSSSDTSTSVSFANLRFSIPAGQSDRTFIRALAPGVIRINASHQSSGGGVTVELRILVNGVQQVIWTTTSTSPVARSADITVAVNDIVQVQHRTQGGSQSSTVTNAIVGASNSNLFVVGA